MQIYIYLLVIVGLYFLIFTILNSHKIYSDTVRDGVPENEQPMVSVLIPARNEEDNIERCVNSFLNQTYKNYEILVLNDNSTDRTGEILERLQKANPDKVRVFDGKPLEAGWRGKSFAMKQLTEYAKGELFLFTDADTVHTEKSIELMVSNIIKNDADMVSGYLAQEVKTFGEKIAIPITYIMTSIAIPLWLNNKLKFSFLSTAIGQFIGIKKESFMAIGGYDAIRNITTEDVYLARLMKKSGYKTVFVDLKDAAKCRMYDSYKGCINGIAKNVYDFLGKSNVIMAGLVILNTLFLIFPSFAFIFEIFKHFALGTPADNFFVSIVFVNAAFFLSWFITMTTRRLPVWISFMYPLIYTTLLFTILKSWIRGNSKKGYVWKGRVVS